MSMKLERFKMGVLVLLCLPARLGALEPLIKLSSTTAAVETVTKASTETATNTGSNSPNKVLPGEPPVRKNYLLPALEIPSFLLLLNGYDRVAYPNTYYNSGLKSSKEFFLHGHWEYDEDTFAEAQLGHPYQGAIMYGFARSAGLNFWEGLVYSNVGSYMWMIGGETDNPRINGQITTGNAGSIFGEELYRMGSLVLERGSEGGAKPAAWREWCAALISPPTGLNRLLFGNRYRWMEARDPETFTRLRVGQSQTATVSDSQPATHEVVNQQATVDFVMDYGLPGKDGYRYIRPLDYFSFQITGAANSANPVENVMTRGLLLGRKYEAGDDYRGVWGLYGSYDYISPQVFRVSSTAGSFGTTAQWWLSKFAALQGTALAGVGMGAAGSTVNPGDRNYHYGTTPQGLLALRLILGDRVMIDGTAREYLVSALGGSENGNESITRVDGSITLRFWRHQALGVQYVFSHRDADYAGLGDRRQSVGTIGVAYNLLGDNHFGAVEWR
jgi:hypothetical protein